MKEFKEEMIDALEEEKEFEKITVTELETIVELVDDKPYYSIRYFDIADMCWHIGYSSYDLKNVVEWKNECFEVVGANSGWIPCDENLPNHNQTVIFQTEDGMVEAGHYDVNEDWCVNDSYFPNAFRFIAWQPLPEPYQQKEGLE